MTRCQHTLIARGIARGHAAVRQRQAALQNGGDAGAIRWLIVVPGDVPSNAQPWPPWLPAVPASSSSSPWVASWSHGSPTADGVFVVACKDGTMLLATASPGWRELSPEAAMSLDVFLREHTRHRPWKGWG